MSENMIDKTPEAHEAHETTNTSNAPETSDTHNNPDTPNTPDTLEIIIDQEFKNLLPVLPAETFALLEESLLEHGCMHPLTLWNDILIDGHNRYEIATRHSIPFAVVSKEFASRDDVIIWIIKTQVERRNLTPKQLSYYRGMHYKAEKRLVTNAKGNNQHNVVVDQNDPQPPGHITAELLGRQYKVSAPTIKRDEKFADALNAINETSPEAKRSILSGETEVTKKYLRELIAGAEDTIADTAKQIEDGTFERPKPANPGNQASPGSANPVNPDPANPGLPDGYPETPTSDAGGFSTIASIVKASEDFTLILRKLSDDGDKEKVKSTLRSHIDNLERLLGQMQ